MRDRPTSPILFELDEAAVRERHKDCGRWTRTGHSGCDVPDLLDELDRTRRALYLAQDECGKRGQDLEAVKLALACSRDNEKALRIKLMEAARLTREAREMLR